MIRCPVLSFRKNLRWTIGSCKAWKEIVTVYSSMGDPPDGYGRVEGGKEK